MIPRSISRSSAVPNYFASTSAKAPFPTAIIPACTFYLLNQNIWDSQVRTPEILNTLVSYGAHAKSAIPELKQAAEMFDKGEVGFPQHMTIQKAADVRKAITEIEAATEAPKLVRIKK